MSGVMRRRVRLANFLNPRADDLKVDATQYCLGHLDYLRWRNEAQLVHRGSKQYVEYKWVPELRPTPHR